MSTPLTFPPCKICTGVATGIHYGVNTCEKCKAFFRRAITEVDKYKCGKDNDCEIIDRRRGNCSSCRLQKCINEGMSKDAVRHGRYTVEQRTKTILEVKQLKRKKIAEKTGRRASSEVKSPGESSGPSLRKSRRLSSTDRLKKNPSSPDIPDYVPVASSSESTPGTTSADLTAPKEVKMEEEHIVQIITKLVTAQDEIYPNLITYFDKEFNEKRQREFYDRYKLKKDTFGLKPLSMDEYSNIYKATGIDVDDRNMLMNKMFSHSERGIAKYISYAKAIPGFNQLNHDDKMALITSSRFEYWYLGHFLHINPDLGVCVGYEVQNHKDDHKKYFGDAEITDELDAFTRTMQKLDISYEEIALLRAIVILFRDRCSLKEPDKVESLQWKLIECLKHLILKLYKKKNSRFTKYMDRLAGLRSLTEKNKKANKQLLDFQKNLLKNYPLYSEFLNSYVKT